MEPTLLSIKTNILLSAMWVFRFDEPFRTQKSCTTCLALSPVKEGHYQVLESYCSPAHYIVVSGCFSPQLICFPRDLHLHFVFLAARARQPICIRGWGNSAKAVTKMGCSERNGYNLFLVFSCTCMSTHIRILLQAIWRFWGLSGLKIASCCTTLNWFSGSCGDSVFLFLFMEASAA